MTAIIIAIIIAPFVLLTCSFAVEVLLGLKPLHRVPPRPVGGTSAVIVVPAHDEEGVLSATLERLKAAASGQARVLLVADNCSDGTARIARDAGVEVVERNDPDRRGKGFALDFARIHLAINHPEVVLVVDADCSIDHSSVSALIKSCVGTGRPCQATNLQQPGPAASPAVQLSTFAFFIKNVIRQRGLKRLAGRVHLLGTGMAFPWHVFAGARLASSNIVEDLILGQEVADAGHVPVFVEEAAVWSKAESDASTITQRRRWEGGFLQNAARAGPRMLFEALGRRDLRLAWAAIDVMIPPFALLIFLDVLALAVIAVLTFFGLTPDWPLYCLSGALISALTALAFAWSKGGSNFVSFGSLVRAPFYVAWKLPMYLSLARRGAPSEWLRTER